VTSQAERIIMEKTPHLQDHTRVQVRQLREYQLARGGGGGEVGEGRRYMYVYIYMYIGEFWLLHVHGFAELYAVVCFIIRSF
jgi:hypothetical protein